LATLEPGKPSGLHPQLWATGKTLRGDNGDVKSIWQFGQNSPKSLI
jgi:hypothetical protein